MICRTCNKDALSVKTLFEIDGKPLPEPKDECDNCKSGGMHNDPAWLFDRPAPLWESRPHLYRKKDNPEGGSYYEPTDENRADLEAQIIAGSSDDRAFIENKAKTRLMAIPEENLPSVLARANAMAANAVQSWQEQMKAFDDANKEYWNSVADEFKQ